MNSGSLNERITRALAFMLRHQPEEFDLELDRFGWGDLEDVIYALQERIGSNIEEEDVVDAIEASDRRRYEIEDDRIRALYGHSFPIDPGEPTEPPDELYIGVGSRDAARAEDKGLRSGRRAFLHLARTEDEAREAGRRAAREYAVITVYAGEAFDEGIDFYDRGSLFLADEIPVEFLEVGDIHDDGIERDHARRSRGRRNNERPRGGARRRERRSDDDADERPRAQGGGGRDRDEEVKPRAPRERAPREKAPREVTPRERAQERDDGRSDRRRDESGGGFGLGLEGKKSEASESRPRKESKPRTEPKPEREPAKAKESATKDTPPSPGFGFGTGLD